MKDPAPLYTQTFDMVKWVLKNVPGTGVLGESIHRDAIRLLDLTVLALKGFEVLRQLDQADATNAVLRVRLRLAHDLGMLDERQLLHLSRQLDEIGRQLGGWLRSIERGTEGHDHR